MSDFVQGFADDGHSYFRFVGAVTRVAAHNLKLLRFDYEDNVKGLSLYVKRLGLMALHIDF
ncbi:MAG TPA: hypothetical protein EYO33_26620 [Phycisphaerales bacterium]|nr:hypothetical protein [Phycisphaerales bacterium]